jgi:hypothetical protein
MDAARALSDLLELSPEVEAAAVFDRGEILGHVGADYDTAGVIVGAAGQMLDGAGELRSDGSRVTQLRAALAEGAVYVVREAEGNRAAVAVATPRATPGLVFYDLKRVLAAVVEEPKPKPKPRPRRRTKKQEEPGDAG